MTVATAGPVAHPLRVKLNWSSSGLLIRGVRVQLASPALCDYSVVGNTRSFQVRISGSYPDNRFTLSACGVIGSRAAFRAQCTKVRVGSSPSLPTIIPLWWNLVDTPASKSGAEICVPVQSRLAGLRVFWPFRIVVQSARFSAWILGFESRRGYYL